MTMVIIVIVGIAIQGIIGIIAGIIVASIVGIVYALIKKDKRSLLCSRCLTSRSRSAIRRAALSVS